MTAAPLPDERVQLWGVDASPGDSPTNIWTCYQEATDPNSLFSKWELFPGRALMIAAAPLPDKRLQLWASASDGTLWTCYKKTIDPNSSFTEWETFTSYEDFPKP